MWPFRRKGFDDNYSPKERLIYTFFDGSKKVRADPIVLFKKISAIGPELMVHLKLAKSISKDAAMGHDRAVARIREVFVLPAFEDGGLSEIECLELFNHFLAYCDTIKKKANQIPTSAMGTSPSIESPSDGVLPTEPTSDSGSTEKGLCTERPSPPPTEPGSPSGS